MNIPSKIVAGDSASWLDVPTFDNLGNPVGSPDWTLSYSLRGATSLDITAIALNGGWKTTITAAQSTDFTAGVYYWQAYATKGSERLTLGSGQIQVSKNLSVQDDGFDGRSQIEIDLAAVQAAMRAMISGGAVQEYTIGNRSIRKMSFSDLLLIEAKLKKDLVLEKRADMIKNGLGDPRSVYVRFRS